MAQLSLTPRRSILPGKATLALVIMPFIVRWGISLGIGGWLAFITAMSDGRLVLGYMALALFPLCIFSGIGYLLGNACRSIMLGSLVESLKRRGDLGRAVATASDKFYANATRSNNGFLSPTLARAAAEAGLNEADSIMADMGRGDASPLLWLRTVRWCEKFGDATNRMLTYSLSSRSRPPHGNWADALIPSQFKEPCVEKLRRSVIQALPYADDGEGTMLYSFLVEANAFGESPTSLNENNELHALVTRAKAVADTIVSASQRLPSNGETGNLERMKRILTEDNFRLEG